MERGRVVLSTVGHTQVDDVLILTTGQHEIAEPDMTAWLERMTTFDFEFMLVSTKASDMNSKQRARIAEFWKKSGREHPKIAVLTDSAVQRHVATAMSWLLGKPVKVVASTQLEEALRYLGCRADLAEVSRTLKAVHLALDAKGGRKAG